MADVSAPAIEQPPLEAAEGTGEGEDWEDEESYEQGDEDGDGTGADAEEIARRLGDHLWAEISKAQADRAGATSGAPTPSTPHSPTRLGPTMQQPPTQASKKEEAAVVTMKTILAYAEKDPLARSTFASTLVPDTKEQNFLDFLNCTVASGAVSKDMAKSLSRVVVSLAGSDALFATLRHSNAASIQLDKGKRKRAQTDEGSQHHDYPASKKLYLPPYDLRTQVTDAVRVIIGALTTTTPNQPLNPSLVASIQLQLHQIFLFAVTSSAAGGPEMSTLQEISGLIQCVGVLSGIQIGSNPPSMSSIPSKIPPPRGFPAGPPTLAQTDIGTAVYPCLVPNCRKMFSRLYSLRAHQRVHAVHRPFRCTVCPASFARNHDLKRHGKLHDKRGWKCGGCDKMFSRRDAIKRHKNSTRMRGGKGEACRDAEILEVELDSEEGDEVVREERRAKMWNNIAGNPGGGVSGTATHHGYSEDGHLEEGEVQPSVIAQAQSAVTSLQGLLRAHVGNTLGIPGESDVDPANGQATLASVIARAQLQNLPSTIPNDRPLMVPSLPVPSPASTSALQQPGAVDHSQAAPIPTLSLYGLSDEQTKMLEQAIANAASAAQAQAEAEAALEEEEEEEEEDYEEEEQGCNGDDSNH
jgi:hypothetical protein